MHCTMICLTAHGNMSWRGALSQRKRQERHSSIDVKKTRRSIDVKETRRSISMKKTGKTQFNQCEGDMKVNQCKGDKKDNRSEDNNKVTGLLDMKAPMMLTMRTETTSWMMVMMVNL
jgi:hypothetical protein